jgi:arylsulfatase A-like enzyme
MPDQPNLLLLLNDHQAYYRHGWDGGPRPLRPGFEALAAGGVDFSRAYTPCPLCMPVRRTLLTGVFPHRHRLLQNSEEQTPAPYELYFAPLAAAGYRNFYFGKWHAGPPGSALDRGCAGFTLPSFGNPYDTPEYRAYLERRGLPTVEHLIEWNHSPHRKNVRPGQRYRGADGWFDASGVTLTPNDTHEAFFLANLACDQLRELARTGQKFAMRVDFWGPHQPYFPTREFVDLYDQTAIPEYGNLHDNFASKPEIYRTQRSYPFGPDGKLIEPSPLSRAEWQRLLVLCYAHTTMIDAAGRRVLDALAELGLADNTLVVWSTDHGDALGCHGGHYDKGTYMPEEMLRVPMALRWPGRVPPGQSCDRLVSLMDLTPTFLEATGTRLEHDMDGRSLMGLCAGSAAGWRDDLMCETHGYGDDVYGRALVTERYKYIANTGQMHELYDLERDPYELENLIDRPELAAVQTDLRRRLAAWQQRTHDPEHAL